MRSAARSRKHPGASPHRPPRSRRLSRAHWAASFAFLFAAELTPLDVRLAAFPLTGFVVLCLVAPPFPHWSFFLPILNAGSRVRSAVALTFDDGPDPTTTIALLGDRAATRPLPPSPTGSAP